MEQLENAVKRARKGEKEAFEIIYTQTHKNVFYTCLSMLKNEQDAEDVMQDSFVTAIKSIESLEDDKKIVSWINVIAANKCRNVLKKKMPELLEDEVLEGAAVEENELYLPEEYIVNKAKRDIVMNIIKNKLSDVLYQTVILYYFNNLSVPEIAAVMECPTGTVTYRLSVARAKIKEGIEKYQKDNNEKLYSITLLPLLPIIFREDVKETKSPNVLYADMIIKASDNSAMKMAKQFGGKKMLKTLKAKIIAGIIGVTGIVAATVAVCVIVNAKDENKVDENKADDNVVNVGDYGTENNENNVDDTVAREKLTYIYEQLEIYFEAVKEGDIDTVVEMTSEECKDYPYLVEMAKYKDTKEFLKALYGEMVYWVDPGMEGFEGNVHMLAEDWKYIYVYVEYSNFCQNYIEEMYLYGLDEGTYIPYGFGISDNSDVIELINIAMENMPMVPGLMSVKVILTDEKGNIKIDSDVFNPLELYHFDLEEGELDEGYIAEYWDLWTCLIEDEIAGVSAKDGYQNNPEECVIIEELFDDKKFEELIEYLESITGKDYKQLYKEKCEKYETSYSYAEYEMLSQSQKQYLAEIIENNVDTYVVTSSNADGDYITVSYIMTCPDTVVYEYTNVKEVADWNIENNIVKEEQIWTREVNFDDFDNFVFMYYQLMGYIYNYVE